MKTNSEIERKALKKLNQVATQLAFIEVVPYFVLGIALLVIGSMICY